MSIERSDDIVCLVTAPNPAEAHIWQQALEGEGVPCRVVGDFLDAGIGDVPGITAEVWVHRDDLSRATSILQRIEKAAHEKSQTTNKITTTADAGLAVQRVFQSKAETKAFYDKISHVYDLLAEHSEGPIRQAGLEKLDAKPGEKVLEIGFGTGHCLVSLAQSVGPTGRVYGLDLSERMRDVANSNLQKAGLVDRVELTCGDAVKLDYPSDMLDAIFMSFTLELFDTPEIPKVLAECRRVLRPGARIVVVAISKEGEGGIIMDIYEWSHRHFPNLVDCRAIFVRRSVEAAGFRIESVEKKSMWVPVEIVRAVKPDGATTS